MGECSGGGGGGGGGGRGEDAITSGFTGPLFLHVSLSRLNGISGVK